MPNGSGVATMDCPEGEAHRRYLSAIRSLAQVRRLLSPSIQVNIAEQQINQQVFQQEGVS